MRAASEHARASMKAGSDEMSIGAPELPDRNRATRPAGALLPSKEWRSRQIGGPGTTGERREDWHRHLLGRMRRGAGR